MAQELAPHDVAGRPGGVRVGHLHREREAVELPLGQRVGAVLLHRVLRRDHEVGRGQRVRGALHGHLPLLHRLEQRRLGPRGGPVHLVHEHHVGEDRTGDEPELAVLLVVDADPREVRGQEVGRRLDPAEVAADRDREGAREGGLARPGNALEQEVALREQAERRGLHGVGVAGDDHAHVVDETAIGVGGRGKGRLGLDHGYGIDAEPRRLEGRAAQRVLARAQRVHQRERAVHPRRPDVVALAVGHQERGRPAQLPLLVEELDPQPAARQHRDDLAQRVVPAVLHVRVDVRVGVGVGALDRERQRLPAPVVVRDAHLAGREIVGLVLERPQHGVALVDVEDAARLHEARHRLGPRREVGQPSEGPAPVYTTSKVSALERARGVRTRRRPRTATGPPGPPPRPAPGRTRWPAR